MLEGQAMPRRKPVSQLHAVAIATRFLIGEEPDADFHEVWAVQKGGQWLVSFGKVFPPGVVESPGGWAVAVAIKTGKAKWIPVL
jgi:hypothetical protein